MPDTPHDVGFSGAAEMDTVAHDVRKPLSAALARLQLIERRVRRGDVDGGRPGRPAAGR